MNAVKMKTAAAATNADTARVPNPASINAQAANATIDPQLILQPDGGHLIGYIFTMRGKVPIGGHQELEPWQKYDTISVLVDYYSRSYPSNGCAVKSWIGLYMMPGTVIDKYLQDFKQVH
jgi:hypothetical protein